jgi:hypothetical protein
MGSWEKFEKGLGRNADNSATPEDKLFMEDEAVMAVMNRLKASETINRLIKEIQGTLQ